MSFNRDQALPFGAFFGVLDVQHAAPGLDVAVRRADPHRIVERHSHEEAHFVFVIDGLYASSAIGAEAVSTGRTLIFNPAGTTHRDTFEAHATRIDGRFLTLSLTPEVAAAETRGPCAPRRATVIRDAMTMSVAERLLAACYSPSTDATLMRESLSLDLMHAVHVASNASAATGAPRWLAPACELLNDRCSEQVTMAEVAAAAGVHPVHLARVFRQYLLCSPGEYLRERRMARATALLRHTTRSLADIALSSGFADQSHFTSAFRRANGASPGVFRRRAEPARCGDHENR